MNGNADGLRETFDSAAQTYDAARPAYPAELFDDLVSLAALEPGDRLLEIGCATGKATRPMLERGFRVVCVEIGAQLAERARINLAGQAAEVHAAPFEEWTGPSASFDLVYAATAWHWVEPSRRYQATHRLLRAGGHLAFWNAQHAFPADFDPFFAEIQKVYDEIGESSPGEWPPLLPGETPDEVVEIEASGHFADVVTRRYLWEVEYTANEYIALLNTFSGHIAMDPAKRDYLYGEIRWRIDRRPGGAVRRHWASILHIATRT